MYRIVTSLVALSLVAVFSTACDNDNGTDPSPNDNVIRFNAPLSAANEVPAVTNAEATASGQAQITLNVTRDGAGNVTSATADFVVTLAGLTTTSVVTLAHIHPGVAGATGSPVVDLGLTSGQVTLTNGAGSFTVNGRPVTADVAQNIINNPAAFYFNVHTAANGPGVARGQLVRVN
jgi:hypothetical protein